jgi:hypothetical protein
MTGAGDTRTNAYTCRKGWMETHIVDGIAGNFFSCSRSGGYWHDIHNCDVGYYMFTMVL